MLFRVDRYTSVSAKIPLSVTGPFTRWIINSAFYLSDGETIARCKYCISIQIIIQVFGTLFECDPLHSMHYYRCVQWLADLTWETYIYALKKREFWKSNIVNSAVAHSYSYSWSNVYSGVLNEDNNAGTSLTFIVRLIFRNKLCKNDSLSSSQI